MVLLIAFSSCPTENFRFSRTPCPMTIQLHRQVGHEFLDFQVKMSKVMGLSSMHIVFVVRPMLVITQIKNILLNSNQLPKANWLSLTCYPYWFSDQTITNCFKHGFQFCGKGHVYFTIMTCFDKESQQWFHVRIISIFDLMFSTSRMLS